MEVDYGAFAGLLRPEKIVLAMVIIAGAVLVAKFVTRVLDRFGEASARRRLLLKRVSSIFRFVVFLAAAGLVVTNVFTLSQEALLALGGTLVVTVSFALKDTAASLISGVLILIDQPFQVGDRITFGGHYGEVKEIGLRSVRIVTLDDNLVSIPTNEFLTQAVASSNAGALDMMVVMDFHISLAADFERAMRLAREATVTSKYVFLNKPVDVLIGEVVIGEELVSRLRVKAYVVDARFESKFASDVTARVKRAFRQHEVVLPSADRRPAGGLLPATAG